MIRDEQEEEQYVGSCPLTLSRGSSNYSQLSLVRVCSYNSNSQEDIIKNIHQRFLKIDSIFQSIQKICVQLQQLITLDKDMIILLLNKYKWKIDILKEKYYSFDYQLFNLEQNKKVIWISQSKKQYKECLLCKQITQLISIPCGHQTCQRCWDGYLNFGVTNERRCFFKCFYQGCQQPVYHSTVLELIHNKSQYLKNIVLDYIQNTKSLSFCPGNNCDYCYEDTSCLSKTVVCIGCKTGFCFKCASQPHQPCNCKQALDWSNLTKKQKCSQSWINQNTKKCPHCRLAVQKTLGCDYILCACKNRFCYKCQRNWDQKHSSHFQCPYESEIFNKPIKKQPQISIQIQALNKVYCDFLVNESKIKSIKNWKFQTLRSKIVQYIQLTQSQVHFINRSKDILIKTAYFIKWGLILQFFNPIYKFKNQKYLKGFNANIISCMNLLTQLDIRLTKLFANSQFLQTPGHKVKDFYKEKGQIQTLLLSMEENTKTYLKYINRD